jgi:murein DD-endopeptidase MepM/ murein hydrolase activator NlpD/Tol biopolymer transport system component
MTRLSSRRILSLTVGLAILLVAVSPVTAQEGTFPPTERPFRLPFAEPPGPDTWLLAQPYGSTTGAYRQRFTTYGASGGIHFGVDLPAPCGTEIVAIADGIVFAVDGPFGSAPHNLMIDHPQLNYASMYGHLLAAPNLRPGAVVKQGQVVALVGDSRGLCHRRAHLHLEIRDLNHVRKFNPTLLVEANWDNLALTSSSGRSFARDLDEPRKWQTLYDQPEARTGGPILNDFANPWPLDWKKRAAQPVTPVSLVVSGSAQAQLPINESLSVLPIGWQIIAGNCCTRPYWSKDSTEVRFIDQPAPDASLGVWGVDVTQPGQAPELVTERLGFYSPDGSLIAYPDRSKGVAIIERLADGQKWQIETQERSLSFTPDSQGVIWTTYDQDAPRDSREETIWLADVDGSNVRAVFSARRTDPIAWLTDNELLMIRRRAGTSDIQLFKLSLESGRQSRLVSGARMRGLAFSPDKRHLVYYVTFEQKAGKNGTWLLDLQNPQQPAEKLPFFGTYRWRDNQRLIYVPLDLEATSHDFYEYDILTKETKPLFPNGTDLTIANNDWRVSPDGRQIALVAAQGTELDGVWVLDIDRN